MFTNSFSSELWESTYKYYKDKELRNTFRRVAASMAAAETTEEKRNYWEEQFLDGLDDFKITVGGRTYANAGTEYGGTTFINCFVGPNPKYDIDSLDGILKVLRDQAQTLKSEGGWGMNFSFIRPRGSFIHGIGVETPGAIKYMELFDKASEIVTSGSGKKSTNGKAKGKIRKGAMMGVLMDWHPDIIEFITAKQTQGRLQKFNVSVGFSDDFMIRVSKITGLRKELESATESRKKEIQDLIDVLDVWELRFPQTTFEHYKAEWNGDLKSWIEKGYPVEVHDITSVSRLWELVMESTYNKAEPGVLFIDRVNYFNPLNYAETILATNPCGEQTLAPGGCCNLGSINLTQFIDFVNKSFDFDKLKKYTKILVRLLDNVNSVSNAPLPEYEYSLENKRRIGVGVMGWASALYMIQVRFGSEEAAKLRDQVISTVARTAYEYSIDLAEEKGMFSECTPDLHVESAFIKGLGLSDEYLFKLKKVGIRNSSLLSIQPTGNTGIFANNVSGGIEPAFMFEYIRTAIVNTVPDHIRAVTPKYWEGEFVETSMFKFVKEGNDDILRGVDEYGVVYKIDRNRGLTKEVLCEDYGVRFCKEKGIWDPNADWAVTANSLTVKDHVNDLAGFARYIDSAISKTVNVPNDYPYVDFKDIYLDAYATGYVKGVTTYRSGTMMSVLSVKEEKNASVEDEEIILEDVKLPDSAPAVVKTLKAEGKKWYLTCVMNESNNRPFALFVTTNVHELNVVTHDALDRLLDLAHDKKIPDKYIQEIMDKIRKDSNHAKIARVISLLLRHGVFIKNIVRTLDSVENVVVGSFLFQIKKFLSGFIKDGEKIEGAKCSECGSDNIIYSEGCSKCQNCGSSKCG